VALNDALLLALCRQQGGSFHSLNPKDDIEQAVTSLGKTLGQPVLLDLQLSEGWEIADAKIPNLYAGQIHYLSARSSNGRPLELAARTPSLENVKIQFQRQTATIDAPYLHWCRSRIDRLVAEGNERAAVALSVESNLICRLTAFVAWDESERVTVASQHLVQPSMSVNGMMFCLADVAAAPAAGAFAKRSRGVRRLFDTVAALAEELPPLRERAALDELELKRELSDICHRTGVPDWQSLVKTILDWIAEASGAERSRRFEALNRLIEEIKVQASQLERLRKQADAARQQIHQLLKMFVDAFSVKSDVRRSD